MREPRLQVVLGDHERRPRGGLEDRLAHLLRGGGIEHAGGLVQQQEVGLQRERAGQCDPLLLAAGGVERGPGRVDPDARRGEGL